MTDPEPPLISSSDTVVEDNWDVDETRPWPDPVPECGWEASEGRRVVLA